MQSLEQNLLRVTRNPSQSGVQIPLGQVRIEWIDAQLQVLASMQGQVQGSDGSQLRIALGQAEPDVMSKLHRWLETGDAGATPERPLKASSVSLCETIASAIRTHFELHLVELLEAADQSLGKRVISDGGTLSEGLYAQEARQLLKATREPLISAFVDDLAKPFDGSTVSASSETTRAPQLRLVDDDELQLWLTRSESVSRLESELRAAIADIHARLLLLSQSVPNLNADALAPEHVLNAMIRAFKVVDLDYPLRSFLIRLCGLPELLELGKFYRRLQTRLTRMGLVAKTLNHQPIPLAASERPRTQPARPQPSSGSRQRLPTLPTAQAISATQRLWALAQPVIGVPEDPTLPIASDEQLLQAAIEYGMHVGADSARSFSAAIHEHAARMGDHGVRMERRQAEAVELLGRLDEALHLDPLLPSSFRGWSRQMFPTLLGTQLGGQDLGSHGDLIKRLFSLLEFGSVLCEERKDPKTASISEQIATIVNQLSARSQLGPGEIEAACLTLEQLLQRQRSAGAAVEERVVEACQGQQRLDEARLQVSNELNGLFGGRMVPECLARLLDENLRAAMVLGILRGGIKGDEWRADMRLLEDIDGALQDAERGLPSSDSDRLTDRIEARLADIPGDAPRQQKLIKDLGDALAGSPLPSIVYRPEGDDGKVRQILQSLDDPQSKAIGSQIDLLRSGDWVAFGGEDEEPRLLKLAWRSSQRSRYVFVNQLGRKTEDLTRTDLLSLIRGGRARILDEGNSTIIERAWRRMLEGMHDELAQRATHDSLTGLLNRKELDRRLEAWMHQRDRRPLVLFWIGVDRLRLVNQAHGMKAGDKMLQAVGRIVQATLEKHEGAATRIAGDEFVLVIEDMEEHTSLALAKQLIDQVDGLGLSYNDRPLQGSISIGVSLPASDCLDPGQMLSDAESACRVAKEMGRGRSYLHQKDDVRLMQMRETVGWVERVEAALREDKLVLYAQEAKALSEAARQRPNYIEVLLRMQGSEGVQTPEQFILAAERYGQIAAVDRFVIRALVDQLGSHPFRQAQVAFNLSSRNIIDDEFVSWVIEQWQAQDFPLDMICVELTETAAIQNLTEAQSGVEKLNRAGIRTVLDDFGSGFSSYRYLKHLPVDIVKVDGAFIRDITRSPEDLALARSINEIAHLLGKMTVAEHVENQATLDLVTEIGFDYAQGFFLAQPQPLAQAYLAQPLGETEQTPPGPA